MFESIDAAISKLANRDAGWVARRDAVEYLGQMAVKAAEALKAHLDDTDRDVRDMVERAAGWVKASVEGVAPVAQLRVFGLDELALSLEKTGNRAVRQTEAGYEVAVTLKEGRSQRVSIEPSKSQAGRDTIRVSTNCGKASEKSLRWALKNNTGLSHCALALQDESGEDMLVMVHSFLADAVTPAELKSSVKEVAYYGDWVESKLTDEDTF